MAKTLCIALKSTALVAEVRHKLLSHSGSEATLEEFAPFFIYVVLGVLAVPLKRIC